MNLDFNILVFLTGFVFALPVIGYLFRFNIPISIFFLLAGVFMLSIFLMTDGIILNDNISSIIVDTPQSNITLISESSNDPRNIYNMTVGVTALPMTGATTTYRAIFVSEGSYLVNQSFNQIGFQLNRGASVSSSPITFGVFNEDKSMKWYCGTVNSGNLTTTMTLWTVTCPTTYTIDLNDRIGILYSGTNTINAFGTATDYIDSTKTRHSFATLAGVWGNSTTLELRAFLTTDDTHKSIRQITSTPEITTSYSYEDNVTDISFTGENYQIKVFLIFISIMFMVGGALVEVRQR